MYRILKYMFLFSVIFLHSAEWQEFWTDAVLNCDKKNYKDAEINFTKAINELEAKKDISHPHVFVDRARLFLLLKRYGEALSDVNKAMKSEHLSNQDLPRAVITRMAAHGKLEMEREALEDLELYKKISPDFPKYEFYQDRIIIRNLPESSKYRDTIKKMLLVISCEKESDIQMLPSGICIAKRKKCCCELNAASQKPPKSGYGEGCKWWCDKAAVGGFTWCGLTFVSKPCQVLCIGSVELLKDGCYWCCNNKGFSRLCTIS